MAHPVYNSTEVEKFRSLKTVFSMLLENLQLYNLNILLGNLNEATGLTLLASASAN